MHTLDVDYSIIPGCIRVSTAIGYASPSIRPCSMAIIIAMSTMNSLTSTKPNSLSAFLEVRSAPWLAAFLPRLS